MLDMMKKHPINTTDLGQWEASEMTMYASHNDWSGDKRVKLWVTLTGKYIVLHGDDNKYTGKNRAKAVRTFNDLI